MTMILFSPHMAIGRVVGRVVGGFVGGVARSSVGLSVVLYGCNEATDDPTDHPTDDTTDDPTGEPSAHQPPWCQPISPFKKAVGQFNFRSRMTIMLNRGISSNCGGSDSDSFQNKPPFCDGRGSTT
jgi:hypothetical protein